MANAERGQSEVSRAGGARLGCAVLPGQVRAGLGHQRDSRAIKSSGWKITCVVPSRYGVFTGHIPVPGPSGSLRLCKSAILPICQCKAYVPALGQRPALGSG